MLRLNIANTTGTVENCIRFGYTDKNSKVIEDGLPDNLQLIVNGISVSLPVIYSRIP